MQRTPFLVSVALAALLGCSTRGADGGGAVAGTAVIVVGEQATTPVPVLQSVKGRSADAEVADLLFLRLAQLGPGGRTSGEDGFVPALASSWSRRDSVTLVFELDPRARWQDGVPVTARDVVFTFERARDTTFTPTIAGLLHHIRSVTADGDHRVVIGFDQPYAEQFYDAVFHAPPLPEHLLRGMTQEQMLASEYVKHPVGDGPYRWVRSTPDAITLAAVDSFFLGEPGIQRVVLRVAGDPDARLNLLLTGDADAAAAVVPPEANRDRLAATGAFDLVAVPSTTMGYILFNQRDPAHPARPHPILQDSAVRRALVLALDRASIVRAVFGPDARVPYGPVSPALWIARLTPAPEAQDTAAARALLAGAGWRDTNGDGTLDRGGRPLRLEFIVPSPSKARTQIALQVQEQLRRMGIKLDVMVLEPNVWNTRHNAGQFDLDFASATQDPTPAGLTQSWSCAGGSNVAHYCDPTVDSLMQAAILTRDSAAPIWLAAVRRIERDTPAAFMYAPVGVYAVSKRYASVDIRAESPWIELPHWSVKPGQAIARDRVTAP